MKFKHILILGIIFAVLLAVTIAKKTFFKPEIFETEYKSLQIQINPSDVHIIEVRKTGEKEDSLELKKDEQGQWQVSSHENKQADAEKIENFIKEIAGLKGELRSSDAELLADYGISDEEAVIIEALDKDGNVKETFLAGTKTPGYGSSFLRKPGSKEVYIVNKNIFQLLGLYGDPKESDLVNSNLISDKPLPEENPSEPSSTPENMKTVDGAEM
ncbi:MAG: DUF4340 domain-containing protein [Candidatus Omnitrophota bacterium]